MDFLSPKMVNLGLIDFQLGDDGQNKFEVHTSKNVASMANFRPKVGKDATFVPTLNWHNSAIFHSILTFDAIKMISSSRRIE